VFTMTAACFPLIVIYSMLSRREQTFLDIVTPLLQSMKRSGLIFSGISDPITVVRFPKIIMLIVFLFLRHKRRETVRLCT
jgi:hypothetical protein